jgi:hypothetical protein
MARKRAAAPDTQGFAIVKDARHNLYVVELGKPVTASLTRPEKRRLLDQFDDHLKSKDGQATRADAVVVGSYTGSFRILEQGKRLSSADSGTDGGTKKKKKP